jgi:hypothetical protein
MDYENEWYVKLKEQAEIDYKMFVSVNKQFFHSELDTYMKDKKHIKFTIRNNELTTQYNREIKENPRAKSAEKLVKSLLAYISANKLKSIDGDYIMRLADACDFEPSIPIFTYCKPHNVKGFLFPDFNIGMLEEKKTMFANRYPNSNKKNIMYFKGTASSCNKTKIREKLEPLSNSVMKVELKNDIHSPYYTISDYKYVLDLPGNYPWSVRLIELYMSCSLPFRVNFYCTREINNKVNWYGQWVQFYELMFPENTSYVNFKYENDFCQEITDKSTIQIKDDFCTKYSYFESNPKLYERIVEENYKKIQALTFEHVYYYMYTIFAYYRELTNQ